jgi:50S ribosomal subunit-associated GTPase HflX
MSVIHEDLQAELARLRSENARLKLAGARMKVTDKGGLSVYGMGRFPVTLYRDQWERLLALKEAILEFIAQNADDLPHKDD